MVWDGTARSRVVVLVLVDTGKLKFKLHIMHGISLLSLESMHDACHGPPAGLCTMHLQT